jgi:hypothetical protein
MSSDYGFRVVDASRSIRRVAADLRRAVARIIERDDTGEFSNTAVAAPGSRA